MTEPLSHVIRAFEASDWPFVCNAWMVQARKEPSLKFVSNDVYFTRQRALVESLVKTETTLLAVDTSDATHTYGFITYSAHNIVHWVYVKSVFWGMGVGGSLLSAATIDGPVLATHATERAFGLLRKSVARRGISFDPYLLARFVPTR